MKINESKKSTPTLKISFLMAMANKFLENIGFTGIINNQTDEGSKSHSNMDIGNLAKAVILSTFYSMRAPLYKIERRLITMRWMSSTSLVKMPKSDPSMMTRWGIALIKLQLPEMKRSLNPLC
ncbi:MAG: hypothetical protein ACYDEX_23770 [Mobilitalea sp.]